MGKTLFSSFSERPKHLDPARAYSSNEIEFIGQIYEPPLQYHFLKRPYELEPLILTEMPRLTLLDKQGRVLPSDAPTEQVAQSVYELHLRDDIRYQPHPAFVPAMHQMDLRMVDGLDDFPERASRTVTAADMVHQIKRLADPRVSSPIYGLMRESIVGLGELGDRLATRPHKGINLENEALAGAVAVDARTLRITLKGRYPQFIYWLAMPFFAPIPPEVERFYARPGMAEKNLSLDWQPVGSGPFLLAENDPNRVMRLIRNPNYHADFYPDRPDLRLPLIDQAVYSLEKEEIPYWGKFLQGYYDSSGIASDTFDQAIRVAPDGTPELSAEMRERNLKLVTALRPSLWYVGFNGLDPVLGGEVTAPTRPAVAAPQGGASALGRPGGGGDSARKLRQALSIALDWEEFISIFLNGRGIPAQGPIPPGIFGHREGGAGVNPVTHVWRDGRLQRRPLDDAKKLMREAGWPEGRHAQTGAPLVLYLDTMAGGADAKARLDWYRKQFAKLGIQLVVRATDYNRFQDKMLKGSAQIFEWGWNADYPDPENFLFLLYGPNRKAGLNGENAANYQNPEFDRLFLRMKDMENGPARQAVIDQMLALVQHDAPWAFAYIGKSYALRHGWMASRTPNLMANNTLKYTDLDPAARVTYQQTWNRPALWPLFAVLAGMVVVTGIAMRAWRRREERRVLD